MAGSKMPLPKWPAQFQVPSRLRQMLQHLPAQWRQLVRTKRFRVIAPAIVAVLLMVTLAVQALVGVLPTHAAPSYSASFSSSDTTHTATVGGILYARQGAALVLSATTTDTSIKCLSVTGALTAFRDVTGVTPPWTFNLTAPAGNGGQTATVKMTSTFNTNHTACTGSVGNPTATYTLDNTPPTLGTPTLTPIQPPSGWYTQGPVTVSWPSASDNTGGSGLATPTPISQSVSADGVTLVQVTAKDNVGNSTQSAVIAVQVDTTKPTISGSRTPDANSNGWNNGSVTVSFTCTDPAPSGTPTATYAPIPSGLTSSCAGQTLNADTPAVGTTVTRSVSDVAGNSNSASVGPIKIDLDKPLLSGAPTAGPNGSNGWYTGNVTIHWGTCSDALSGIDGSCPADSTISSEGTGQTTSASVTDKAGNSTTATSSPSVKIDKTAPTTSATAPGGWNNAGVTVNLNATDSVSGVQATHYIVDGGSEQASSNGSNAAPFTTGVSFTTDGDHTLEYWSVDNAGNAEAHQTVHVKIDQTPPTIAHDLAPAPNGAGWNKSNVTVTFTCGDATSGVAKCEAPATANSSCPAAPGTCQVSQDVTSEGKDQPVTGKATDNAGNTATDPATVSIDKTPPKLDGAPDRAPDNGSTSNPWYRSDVTVSWTTCSDALSGIAGSCPAPTTLHEGANQSANASVGDAADNTTNASVGPINIDETAPSLGGAPTTSPNGNGWYNGDVTIHWGTCSDGLSGLAGPCPADSTITGEGDNLSAGASISDNAGNTASTTVGGIKIDRTAPGTTANVPDPLSSGWYAGPIIVTLNASDNLSDVATTYYSIDGGTQQTYSAPFNHSLGGVHTITFWSVDNAGNVENNTASKNTITIKIDDVKPTITAHVAPAANGNGWNNSLVTVSFDCDDQESGVQFCTATVNGGASQSQPVTLDEGKAQSVTGTATDYAGNTESTTVSDINIDLTAPSAPDATINPAAPAYTDGSGHNWYKGTVTISYSGGSDALSGVDPTSYTAAQTFTTDNDNPHNYSGTVKDNAGNESSATTGTVYVDATAPTINYSGSCPTTLKLHESDSATSIGWTASDGQSGLSTPSSGTLSLDTSTVGTHTMAVPDAADNVGNVTHGRTCSYGVGYSFSGFLQPINDTAHSLSDTQSVFKGGSTVPVKFQLTDANGQLVQSTNAPQWLTPVVGGPLSSVVNETLSTATATTDSTYRWDSTGQQYIYNWSTKGFASGKWYTVGVKLDDGQTYTVMIGLK